MLKEQKRKNKVTSKITIVRVPANQLNFNVLFEAMERMRLKEEREKKSAS